MELFTFFMLFILFYGLPCYRCCFRLISPKIRRERRIKKEKEGIKVFLKQHNLEQNGLYTSIGNISVSINCYKNKDIIKIWDCKRFLSIHELNSHSGGTSKIRLYSKDVIGTAGKTDRTINLWNLQTGQIIQKIDLSKRAPSTYKDICDFDFSYSKRLVTVIWGSFGYGYAQILEIHTGNVLLLTEVLGKVKGYFVTDDEPFTIVSTQTFYGELSSLGDGDYEQFCHTKELTQKFDLKTGKLLENEGKIVESRREIIR